MKDTNLPGLQCDGDTKCCAQEREEIFFPEGQAVVAFPALRLSHVGPSLTHQGCQGRTGWRVMKPSTCHFMGHWIKMNLSLANTERPWRVSVRDSSCCGWLFWGAWAELQGASWPARLGKEKGKFRPPNPARVGLGKGTGAETGAWNVGIKTQQNHFPLLPSAFTLDHSATSLTEEGSGCVVTLRAWASAAEASWHNCQPWVMGKWRPPLPPRPQVSAWEMPGLPLLGSYGQD